MDEIFQDWPRPYFEVGAVMLFCSMPPSTNEIAGMETLRNNAAHGHRLAGSFDIASIVARIEEIDALVTAAAREE